jgi:hypothetical protein
VTGEQSGGNAVRPVLDYRSAGAARVKHRRTPEESLAITNAIIAALTFILFGALMVFCMIAKGD